MGWTNDVVETVDRSPLAAADRLARHCFWDGLRRQVVDDEPNPLADEVGRGDSWGRTSVQWIDDLVSDALGIERASKN